MNSVTTVKRLIEVWPESKELLPKEADKASTALPALRVEDLGNDSNLLIVFYVQIMPDDFVMQLHRF
ncbi:Nmad5 family putative nucleotide modification protein [Escherichia coli]|nr:Nmad5 family putative nucleotide modification protein [Escherichia coli]